MIYETKTYLKFKDKPQDNFPVEIICHHTGGSDAQPLLDTSNQTAKIVEDYHLSLGWEGIGYTYFIEKLGQVWKGRPETYHGSHTVGHNTKSIGICLAGNFDLTLPTPEQITSLTSLMKDIMTRYNIPKDKIFPHRAFAVKTCYGMKLSNNWAKDLIDSPIDKEKIKQEIRDRLNML